MGWRSQEQTQQLKRKTRGVGTDEWHETGTKARRAYASGEIPANLPDRFFNEEGEVDLSKVTGNDAVKYLAAIGINVPVGGGVSRS